MVGFHSDATAQVLAPDYQASVGDDVWGALSVGSIPGSPAVPADFVPSVDNPNATIDYAWPLYNTDFATPNHTPMERAIDSGSR